MRGADVGDDAIDLAHRRQVSVETAAHHGHGHAGVDIGVAAEPFIPTMPNADPGRDGTPPGRCGLKPNAHLDGKPMTSS